MIYRPSRVISKAQKFNWVPGSTYFTIVIAFQPLSNKFLKGQISSPNHSRGPRLKHILAALGQPPSNSCSAYPHSLLKHFIHKVGELLPTGLRSPGPKNSLKISACSFNTTRSVWIPIRDSPCHLSSVCEMRLSSCAAFAFCQWPIPYSL